MSFDGNFAFAEKHMPAVRRELGALPAHMFFDILTAPAMRDMQEATDLILSLTSCDIAVRVRRQEVYERNARYQSFDWSVRARCNGHKTEIHKLREGFARWYFMAYSSDDDGELAVWWLLDLDAIRSQGVLDLEWPTYPNNDGRNTWGTYIPINELRTRDCIVAEG